MNAPGVRRTLRARRADPGRRARTVRAAPVPSLCAPRPRLDRHREVTVQAQVPVTLRQQLRRWAAEHDMPVSYAVVEAIRLLLDAPEPETPFAVVDPSW